jgi:hypothetical protein
MVCVPHRLPECPVCQRKAAPQAAPATPAEAEEIARKAVGDYLTACRMTDPAQIGNYLMKLCSVAGVVMAQAEGSEQAADRLAGTAAFIFKTMPKNPAALNRMQ